MMWQAFQSTLPRRERRRLSRIRTGGGTISIHAPAKGATIQPFWTAERSPVFQSTLPRRERRDIPTPKVTPRHEISIHAPAKGATPLASEVKQQLSISIHAPAKGATDNNRPRNACGFISIHAPAKGATSVRQTSARPSRNFNPRSREGSDPPAALWASSCRLFQSTLPRRERRLDVIHVRRSGAFQSTLPRRERRVSARAPSASQRFQSTLPRRERRCYDKGTSSAILISIHAPAKGATIRPSRVMISTVDFNPRSREGSDAAASLARYSTLSFQSTLP